MVEKKETRAYLLDAAEELIACGCLSRLIETMMDWIDMSTDIRVASSLWDEVASCKAERGCTYGCEKSVGQGSTIPGTDEDHR